MKLVSTIVVGSFLAGCAHFTTPNDYIIDGLVKGAPFVLNRAAHPLPQCKPGADGHGVVWTCGDRAFDLTQPVIIIPVQRQSQMPCKSTACTQITGNQIYILQRPDPRAMLNDFFHEYHGHGSGGRHAGDTHGPVIDERAALLERERARNLARMGIEK